MPDRDPSETRNLDGYGNVALDWSRPHDLLVAGTPQPTRSFFLSTSGPDGRPHVTGIGIMWHDGDLYFCSGPATQKARNLAANPACAISVGLEGIDVVLEGSATLVTDRTVVGIVAAIFRDSGWPVEARDGRFTAAYSAPSAGPPPWDLYRFTFDTVYGVGTAEPNGATRWRFS